LSLTGRDSCDFLRAFLLLFLLVTLFVGIVVHVLTGIELSSLSPLRLQNFLEQGES
jgi:hypothetical protein